MTDFSQSFQLGSILQQGTILGSTAYVGGGYLPTNVTTNPVISSISSITLSSTLSFNSSGSASAPTSTTQLTVSVTSGTSSTSNQDALLGTMSITLVGGSFASSERGKGNGKDGPW